MFAIFIHLLYTIGRRWNLENVESIDQVYTFFAIIIFFLVGITTYIGVHFVLSWPHLVM